MTTEHRPVLLNEVLDGLNIQADGIYIDGTFGRGGHSQAILARLNAQGRLFALDQDPEAITVGQALHQADPRFIIEHTPFMHLQKIVEAYQLQGKINGILLDLGVSSPQLDTPERGFSFMRDGALDMRMDTSTGEPVSEWLARATEQDIATVLKTYGEERHARRIAKAIVSARTQKPLTHTCQLAEIIRTAHPAWEVDRHPATRSFQGLRIFTNQELAQIESVLPQALAVLAQGGRLAVISFHSLEDRIVKRFFRDEAKGDPYPPNFPIPASMLNPTVRLVGKAVHPSDAEVAENPRARSAVLRIAERL
ncbi:16S rRNA (cytosine(1402)-N(4))-methyltransferase RsmH [Beggiatoa leptomitoformis]|uniref:Ribosomal RNA small subunit methyltransferase H n=1 Tax=Beggiatoa leptomitoformis TaxID=288004 RepID=A0A2N9YF99_9GAMM|nr:16S rRNA (cytosine(1402)-N(4))-methyltransferase RsmH [Beggiatoa leptomitoformis]ALG68495.1 16S rRNA (cytosine(1402)-N(4))-methyltransferase RsmH [Beggiatoa leptomitoformis]AUI69168.1 16S rRNA (cytosine(1402)-N(4))-methyltransferase RsmH [Beggiatoa leptomitoformis]